MNGTAAGQVAVTDLAQDLLSAITTGAAGSCSLQYDADADSGDSPGSDAHSITYTIVSQ